MRSGMGENTLLVFENLKKSGGLQDQQQEAKDEL